MTQQDAAGLALSDQRQAAARHLLARLPEVARHDTVITAPPGTWPEWFADAVALCVTAADVDGAQCGHLAAGPAPAQVALGAPGFRWCTAPACTEVALNTLGHAVQHCDGCGAEAPARYRLVTLVGHLAVWALVCLDCRAELVGPC